MRRKQTISNTLRTSRFRHGGFSLVELMVVIGVIAVLASILIPVVSRAKRQAKNVQCLSNIRTLQTALMAYVSQYRHTMLYQDYMSLPGQLFTWEGNLAPMYANEAVRLCPEATESSGVTYGSSNRAYGMPKSDPRSIVPIAAPANPGDTTNVSYGSYGLNGYLYDPDPAQKNAAGVVAPTYGGLAFTNYVATTYLKYWFEDVTTLDGGDIPATVTTIPGVTLPPGFGGAASVPAFGDCNYLDSFPVSSALATHDKTPTPGAYNLGTGDTSGKGGMLGRFCLDRHPHGVNIVFLDGHAATVPWAELWQLRWNKSFVPVQVTDVLFKDR